MVVQSVLFVKAAPHLWKTAKAKAWLTAHGYSHAMGVDRKGEHLRFRQHDPIAGMAYRTITLPGGKGVKMVVEVSKRAAKAAKGVAEDAAEDIAADRIVEAVKAGKGKASASSSSYEVITAKRRRRPKVAA